MSFEPSRRTRGQLGPEQTRTLRVGSSREDLLWLVKGMAGRRRPTLRQAVLRQIPGGAGVLPPMSEADNAARAEQARILGLLP